MRTDAMCPRRSPASLLSLLALLAACAPAMPSEAASLGAQQADSDDLSRAVAALEFREVGPTIMGGRVADLAVVESDPRVFYVGTATGGVWKTENAGIGFEMVFDHEPSIGDVTVAPSNPNVVWVGTGEPQNRQSSPWGSGVYRSLDAGRSWTHVGLEDTRHIARIQVHPTDPDVAYVAAVGHLWGDNAERGVYRTDDGGETWEKVLFVDERTGAIDLAMDPGDPRTLFAAMYQRQRKAWGFNGGGPGSGIYRTLDGGETWEEMTDGLPEGDKGRIGLDIYRRDGNLVCAIVEADPRVPGQGFGGGPPEEERENGVYCSTDRGASWEHRSTTNNRPMYYSQIRIDPNDPERMYLGGSRLYKSQDGGHEFSDDAASGVHSDHHALWIDPADSDHLLLGGDGGVSVSWDRSAHWYQFRNLPIAQFYEVGVDMRDPYHVCGGLQDNGSWCAPTDTWSNQGIRPRDWYNVASGDGFFTVMHPSDTLLMFAESQGGFLRRVNLAAMESAFIRPEPRPLEEGEERDLRWNWDTPVLLSAHDDQTVYVGSNVLFRSTDLGRSWTEISSDLTYGIDRDSLEIMAVAGGEPQMSRNDGQGSYGNLTAIAESPVDGQVIFTGADDGRLHVTRDGGTTWTDVTDNVEGLPDRTYVTRIVASHDDAGTVYVAFDSHRNDDYAPYVYVSRDYGQSWRAIVDGLPRTSVNALAQHPRRADLLFVGNEVGVYFSIDGGASWVRMDNGLPNVPVDDITIHPRENDLVLGTHGRGIWIMDDITPLEELTPEVAASSAHLFGVRRATSYNPYRPQGWTPGVWEAENPPVGARIRYRLGQDMDTVSLEIMDAMGSRIRELEAPADEGMHEVVWDLRLVEGDADGEAMDPGPRVLPGVYLARLSAGDNIIETEVSVRLDPRIDISRSDLMARQEAMLESYRLSGPVEQAEDALEELAERLEDARARLEEAADAPGDLTEDVAAFLDDVEAVEEELDDASGGANLWFRLQGSTSPPTEDQLWLLERSWEEVPPIIRRINEMLTERMPALQARMNREGIQPEPQEAVPMPRRGG